MVKLLIQVPKSIKAKLDALWKEGTTASGFIRSLLEHENQENVPGVFSHPQGYL